MSLSEKPNWQQKYVEVLGRQVSVVHKLGENDKLPLVFVHGWLDNAASFELIASFLDEYEIYLVELSGHGKSDHIGADAHYHLVDWVYEFKLVVKQLELDKFSLIGHSLGGILASIYSTLEQDKIDKLILLESAGAFVQPNQDLVENLKAAFTSRDQLAIKTSHSEKNKLRPISLLPSLIDSRCKVGDFNQEIASILIERNIERKDAFFIWRSDARLKTLSPIRLSEEQAVELVSHIHVPCLIILGETGFKSISEDLERRQAYFNNMQHTQVPGGHHFHLEHPELAAQKIIEYLSV